MSFLEAIYGELLSFFSIVKPKVAGRFVNTTTIPFASKDTKLVDKSLSYCKLLFVSVEGNLKNSDITTIRYKKHDSDVWLQKVIYGCGFARFSVVIEKLEITPNYGDVRFGRCIVTYEGSYWEGKYIGSDNMPINITINRDLMWFPRSIIQNPYFQQGFTGWLTTKVSLKYTGMPLFPFCVFPDLESASIEQYFPIPIGVDWFTELYLELWAMNDDFNVDLLRVDYYYTDGSSSNEVLQCASSGFVKKVLSPTSGKTLCSIRLHHLATYKKCGVRSVLMVF